jgi:UDP-N-acetylmuramyl pentapeptide phosphotransferase/UDP-N-acetylglucosamine-1-phosphate transferase
MIVVGLLAAALILMYWQWFVAAFVLWIVSLIVWGRIEERAAARRRHRERLRQIEAIRRHTASALVNAAAEEMRAVRRPPSTDVVEGTAREIRGPW